MGTEKNQWGLMVDEDVPHLGGYHAGGDWGCRNEAMFRWLVDDYGVRSVIDVGCGDGAQVRWLIEELGVQAVGVDGIPQDDPQVVCHDYTTGPWPARVRGNRMEAATDLAWSCEFVEHVQEEFIPNFVETFLMASTVLMTHAVPGQGGHHHVNCQNDDYWIGVMAGAGLEYDAQLTAVTRELADPNGYYHRTGQAFKNRGL